MSNSLGIALASMTTFVFMVSLFITIHEIITSKRSIALGRLKAIKLSRVATEEDILKKPLFERTFGFVAKAFVSFLNDITPKKILLEIDKRLERSGLRKNVRAIDLLATQVILGITVSGSIWFLLASKNVSSQGVLLISLTLGVLTIYIPWFSLALMATKLQREIKKNLPDIMDLLVISVEAGLSFDMALVKIVERFPGPIAVEFQKVLREMQLGKQRKEALKDLAMRVNLAELTNFVNSVIQSEQLGVGLGNVIRLQAELIRDKRQQYIEEQAMKAPVKMLFPLVFFIFPCIFIIILGPALLNIMKTLGN